MDVTRLIQTDIAQESVWAMPSDTIYGLSCLAFDQQAIAKLDVIKNRPKDKSYIVLIGEVVQLELFGIELQPPTVRFLETVWPGPVSVVLPGVDSSFSYLGKSNDGIAFRLPDDKQLRDLCKKHGPVVTTSANRSGSPSFLTAVEIEREFKDEIDFVCTQKDYVPGSPSNVIKLLR